MVEWLLDHVPEVVVCLVLTLIAGAAALIIATGGASCPKGQHLVFEYFQPLIVSTKTGTIVSEIPIYGCRAS